MNPTQNDLITVKTGEKIKFEPKLVLICILNSFPRIVLPTACKTW